MYYVYLLQSAVDNRLRYTGFTRNLRARLARHNAGQNQSTVHGRPWRLAIYFAFADETKARSFKRYLKSGSGKTFARRHFFWIDPTPGSSGAASLRPRQRPARIAPRISC